MAYAINYSLCTKVAENLGDYNKLIIKLSFNLLSQANSA